LKQAIVDKNPVVSSAALVSGLHLLKTNPELLKDGAMKFKKVFNPDQPLFSSMP
jgi:hypothetical protein